MDWPITAMTADMITADCDDRLDGRTGRFDWQRQTNVTARAQRITRVQATAAIARRRAQRLNLRGRLR